MSDAANRTPPGDFLVNSQVRTDSHNGRLNGHAQKLGQRKKSAAALARADGLTEPFLGDTGAR